MVLGFSRKKIKSKKTAGEKLKLARCRLGYNLLEVEKETKVSLKYLICLEKGEFENLPAKVYVLGFLRRYAEFLNLDSQKIIKDYQQEIAMAQNLGFFKKKKKDSTNLLKPKRSDRWFRTPSFIITPKWIFSVLVTLIVLGILSYIWYQVKGFAAAPPLEVDLPTVQSLVNVESLTISGETDPGASLSINNQYITVDTDGRYSQEVKLASGMNDIEIKSVNKAGKVSVKTLKILAEYEEGQEVEQ